jgi:hypothetical protein
MTDRPSSKGVLKHGLSTEPVPVSAYVGSSKNLKDLKDLHMRGIPVQGGRVASSQGLSLFLSVEVLLRHTVSVGVNTWRLCWYM